MSLLTGNNFLPTSPYKIVGGPFMINVYSQPLHFIETLIKSLSKFVYHTTIRTTT